jgi:hypothetical protein
MTADGHLEQTSDPAVFGDFWRQAARLACPPPYPDPPAGAQQVRHVTAASLRAVAVMRRYIGDIAASTGVRDGLWAAAVARAQTATTRITGALGPETTRPPGFPGGSFAARLDGYAAMLTYSRDLLHTHVASTAYGGRRALSDWAPVISSAPVNRALLAGLAITPGRSAPSWPSCPWTRPPAPGPPGPGSGCRPQPGSCANSTRPCRPLNGRRRSCPRTGSC